MDRPDALEAAQGGMDIPCEIRGKRFLAERRDSAHFRIVVGGDPEGLVVAHADVLQR